jgi:hypothetical protein
MGLLCQSFGTTVYTGMFVDESTPQSYHTSGVFSFCPFYLIFMLFSCGLF